MSRFDDLDGKFSARLREISSTTRTTSDGNATITFRTARIDASYSPEVLKKVEAGRLVAIPNVLGVGTDDSYSIYEVADVYPMHYSMLTLNNTQPETIRKEFMGLIEKEWKHGSKSTWTEIVAAPTGYTMNLNENKEPQYVRRNIVPLTGSQVHLLSKELIRKFICYDPKLTQPDAIPEEFSLGKLLGVSEEEVQFTVNIEKLLHYHVGVFAFTGAGKSNLTSLIIRKALTKVQNLKVVILDISSEYGISILDVLKANPSRMIFLEPLRGKSDQEKAEDYYRRHVVPEALLKDREHILSSIQELIAKDKVRTIEMSSESDEIVRRFSTYGGLMNTLADTLAEKYGATGQKMLIPKVIDMIKGHMRTRKLSEDAVMGTEAQPMVNEILNLLREATLRQDAAIISIFRNLQIALESKTTVEAPSYDPDKLLKEIMNTATDSPKIFVLSLPDAETARDMCSDLIRRTFKVRKESFTLDPRVLFVFDEAQEFIPQERRREDGTEASSKAVERLLRHGRKYHLHGWISTQRIAHLNTNALQQLHSYFVSTMPRPYDRQLISDTFAIDDAFVDRTLMFQNGDWLMTSFKATNTQNVPVFFHALNNEDYILG
jgi:uncharacterized protein